MKRRNNILSDCNKSKNSDKLSNTSAYDRKIKSGNGRLPQQLTAFQHRNYRLFFFGQIISLTGTWLQNVAQGWLVLQITDAHNRALMLGVVGALSSLPVLLFSLPAGLLADRFNKRNLIIVTQICAMILAFTLSALVYYNIITIYHIIIIGFLLGTVNAFDAPTRQSFVIEMVGKEDLVNAITLNSAMFNGARIVGPAIAGTAIAALGIAGAFLLNGISFIAVIIGLFLMKITHTALRNDLPAVQGLKEGFGFVRSNQLVSALLVLTAIVSIFATSYVTLMPLFVKDIFHLGARHLGYLMSAVGFGAIIGAITLSSMSNFKAKGRLLLLANLTYCTMLLLFSFSRVYNLSLVLLVIAGWGVMINMALVNTLIQSSVPDQLRGRVMSIYTLMFIGMAPVGNFQTGLLAHWFTAPNAIRIGSVICAVAAILLSPRFINYRDGVGDQL
ncbi:MAG: MFS transporter [Armatimonadota bacterium]